MVIKEHGSMFFSLEYWFYYILASASKLFDQEEIIW